MEEEANIARMKLDQKGDGQFEFKDNDGAVKEIGSVNPIEDFKKMVTDRKVDRVGTAIDQMKDMITKLVNHSLHGDLYQKAIECLAALREACVNEDEAQKFNLFMEILKKKYTAGSNKDFFDLIVQERISLITKDESSISSTITAEEAKQVKSILQSI